MESKSCAVKRQERLFNKVFFIKPMHLIIEHDNLSLLIYIFFTSAAHPWLNDVNTEIHEERTTTETATNYSIHCEYIPFMCRWFFKIIFSFFLLLCLFFDSMKKKIYNPAKFTLESTKYTFSWSLRWATEVTKKSARTGSLSQHTYMYTLST